MAATTKRSPARSKKTAGSRKATSTAAPKPAAKKPAAKKPAAKKPAAKKPAVKKPAAKKPAAKKPAAKKPAAKKPAPAPKAPPQRQSLRLHRSIYPAQAVKETVAAFSELAEITVERQGDYLQVSLLARGDIPAEQLTLEFANFALSRAARNR